MRRTVGWLVAMALVAAGTWLVADRMESPDQVAAHAEPPPPVPVTALLRAGYVQGRMTLTVTAVQDSRAISGGEGVVTRTAITVDETLEAGRLLANVDGRPRIVLTGPFELYRDLGRGDRGDDVTALQTALQEAGYQIGRDTAGVLGAGTLAALERLYGNADATLPTRIPEEGSPGAMSAAAAAGPVVIPASSDAGTDTTPGTTASPARERYLPAQEILMLSGLPATVGSVAGVGQHLDPERPLVQLLSGEVRLASTVPTGAQGPLVVGAQGTFTDADGAAQTATVAAIDTSPDGSEVTIRTDAPGRVEAGGSYVLTVDNPAAEEEQAILAPIAGIVTRGGRTYVYVPASDGFTEVEVVVAATSGGVAAIAPVDAAQDLSEGTEIRIG